MNWDQIESKWTAMTRRVQAEWPRKAEDRRATAAKAAPPPLRPVEPQPALSGAPTAE